MKFFITLALLAATSAFGADRVIINPDVDGDIKLKINDGGVVTDVLTITGSTGAITYPVNATQTFKGKLLLDSTFTTTPHIEIGKEAVSNGIISTPEQMYFNVDSDATSAGLHEFTWGTNRAGQSGGSSVMTLSDLGKLTLPGNGVTSGGHLVLGLEGANNGIINSPLSIYMNVDSDNTNADDRVFEIAKNRAGTTGGSALFSVDENAKVTFGAAGSTQTHPLYGKGIYYEAGGAHIDLQGAAISGLTAGATSAAVSVRSTGATPYSGVFDVSCVSGTASTSRYFRVVYDTGGATTESITADVIGNGGSPFSMNFPSDSTVTITNNHGSNSSCYLSWTTKFLP